jgi:hypothetical protein
MKDIVALVGGIGVFGFGLYRYYVGQLWKKSEFAASQLDLLWKDERIRFCCLALDWSTKRIVVPEPYKAFEPQLWFMHTCEKFQEALRIETEKSTFEWPMSYYRECFDRFFDYLSSIDHYINIGLVSVKDVLPLHYWLKQISEPRFTEDKKFLRNYSRHYEFDVDELLAKFEQYRAHHPV